MSDSVTGMGVPATARSYSRQKSARALADGNLEIPAVDHSALEAHRKVVALQRVTLDRAGWWSDEL
jgi:hypothetical protein